MTAWNDAPSGVEVDMRRDRFRPFEETLCEGIDNAISKDSITDFGILLGKTRIRRNFVRLAGAWHKAARRAGIQDTIVDKKAKKSLEVQSNDLF